MAGIKSLELAIEVAERRREQADQALMQIRRSVQYARGQLDQLQSYASETDARWTTATASTVSAELMLHHRQFTQRLRHAIELQQGVVTDLQKQEEFARQRCLQEEVRVSGLEKLLRKKLNLNAMAEARREQKQMDEWALLKHTRDASHGGGLNIGDQS